MSVKKIIIALGAGPERSPKRFDGALSIYLSNREKGIDSRIITSGDDWGYFEEIKEHVKEKCERFGLDQKETIIPEIASTSTRKNIEESSKLIGKDVQEVDIVTEPRQVAEAMNYARKFLKGYKVKFYTVKERWDRYIPIHIVETLVGFGTSLMPEYVDDSVSKYWRMTKAKSGISQKKSF